MSMIKEKLIFSNNPELSEYFDLLSGEQQKELVNNMINSGEDVAKIAEFKASGKYIRYAPAAFIVKLFEIKPEFFFDGKVWDESYVINDVGAEITTFMQERIKALYISCLNDVLFYLKYKTSEETILERTKLAVKLLKQKVIE